MTHAAMLYAGAVPNLMQAVLWIWPVMYKSIYGRFLLLQLGNTSNIVILNVLISVYNVAGRLATRQVNAPLTGASNLATERMSRAASCWKVEETCTATGFGLCVAAEGWTTGS